MLVGWHTPPEYRCGIIPLQTFQTWGVSHPPWTPPLTFQTWGGLTPPLNTPPDNSKLRGCHPKTGGVLTPPRGGLYKSLHDVRCIIDSYNIFIMVALLKINI